MFNKFTSGWYFICDPKNKGRKKNYKNFKKNFTDTLSKTTRTVYSQPGGMG